MLDLHLGLMIFVLVVFLFLIYQLNDRLFVPLLKFMDERKKRISHDLKSAQNLSTDSDELLAKAAETVDKARSNAAKMRQEAIEAVKAENAKALEIKTRELEAEYEKFKEKLSEEEEALKTAVLSQLPLIKESIKAKFSQI